MRERHQELRTEWCSKLVTEEFQKLPPTERVRTYLNMLKITGSHLQKDHHRSRTRKRRLGVTTMLRQIAGDGAESCNPQIWRPPTPRRRPRSGLLLRMRHRGQVRRLQGRCCKFPLLFSPLVILRAILLSVSLTNLYQQGEETSSDLKQYCRIDRDLYYLVLSTPGVKIQSFFLLNC